MGHWKRERELPLLTFLGKNVFIIGKQGGTKLIAHGKIRPEKFRDWGVQCAIGLVLLRDRAALDDLLNCGRAGFRTSAFLSPWTWGDRCGGALGWEQWNSKESELL